MIKKWYQYNESKKKVPKEDESSNISRLDTTEDEIYNYALKLIDDKINDVFIDTHQEFDTESGDITPDQTAMLDNLQKKIAKLIAKQVHQNLGKNYGKIKSSDIDINALKDLKDERKLLKAGDDVILVYFDGGFSIYRCKLQYISKEPPKLGWKEDHYTAMVAGRRGSPITYELEDAYMAVSVETYNDFCDSDKRLN